MKKTIIKTRPEFIAEGIRKKDLLNELLDKISEFGLDSLSNHDKNLLNSYSDNSVDVQQEIIKQENKFKTSKKVIKDVGLHVDGSDLGANIGRYVIYKRINKKNQGLIAWMGTVYEIVAIQKHWGFVDGKYVPNKIGYRLGMVGKDNDFGRVGDVDEVIFVNMTEDEAILKNNEIMKKLL